MTFPFSLNVSCWNKELVALQNKTTKWRKLQREINQGNTKSNLKKLIPSRYKSLPLASTTFLIPSNLGPIQN